MNDLRKFILIASILVLYGCLNDNPVEEHDFQIISAAEILHYLEEHGNFVFSEDAPALINASNVYENRFEYEIIDLREKEIFIDGHIETAVHVETTDLWDYIQAIDNGSTPIVIVSRIGTKSGYYTTLLRLLGKNNIYSLNFGMASWHIKYGRQYLWEVQMPSQSNFNRVNYEKDTISPLPQIEISKNTKTIDEKLLSRVKNAWNRDFMNKRYPVVKLDNYSMQLKDKYFVCYGGRKLYNTHQIGVVHYMHDNGRYDLLSSKLLQTLPTDRNIYIYSYLGQLSSMIAAYLSVLGYKTIIVRDGTMSFLNLRSLILYSDHPFAIDSSKVMHIPLVKGP